MIFRDALINEKEGNSLKARQRRETHQHARLLPAHILARIRL